ncbi:MAG: hypothetical protein AAB368_01170 [bacterium]
MRERADCRCSCGKLLARAVPEGLELKCRGCGRRIVIGFDGRDWLLTSGAEGIVQVVSVSVTRPEAPQRPAPEPVPIGGHQEVTPAP